MQARLQKDLKILSAFVIICTALWTLILGSSLVWNIKHEEQTALDLARNEAQAYFNKDQAFRLWATSHGGIYVETDERTPANPNLSHMPERDLVTPSGRQLTLMNPAYMLRQLMEEQAVLFGVKSKLTSLHLFNPNNAPDAWEQAALKTFEKGQDKLSELNQIDNSPYLRFIRPMITEEGCLKCHASQGYKVGDVRGGLSIAIPMAPYWSALQEHKTRLYVLHVLLWSLGLIVLFFLTHRGKQMIITRIKLEEEREKTNQQMALILNSLNEGVFGLDQEGRCTFVNPATVKMCGFSREELLHQGIHDIIHHTKPDGNHYPTRDWPLSRTLQDGAIIRVSDELFWKKDGTGFPVEYTSTPMKKDGETKGGVVIFRDLTLEIEKDDLEKQLWQAQKQEAIGTLAGGIAHDFNNILSVIIGYGELALENIPEKNPALSDVQQIMLAGDRAKNLVQQILTFSRQSEQELQPFKVQPVLRECLKLLRASIPTTIDIQQHIDETGGKILGDPTKLHQIVMNLCTNAYHAMREQGGIIKISLSQIELNREDLGDKLEVSPGIYMRLAVSDTGSGIDKITMKKIFDPYFTTKDKGDGTGLGLSIVHGIVKSLNGAITVYSEMNQGTTFHVYIPEISEQQDPGKTAFIATEIPRGNERILVVDDEEAIAHLIHKMLTNLGYKVTTFTSSIEALEAFQKQPENFDLIISDMTMPKMTGMELCRKILQIAPDIPIIICTGFSELITEQKAQHIGAKKLIMKPVIRSDMAQAIREVLDHQ